MSYSTEVRKKVLDLVASGVSKSEAARRVGITRICLCNWLKAEDPLLIKKPGPKAPFRLNREELKAYMEANPEASMKKIADHFGVANSTVWYACQKLS